MMSTFTLDSAAPEASAPSRENQTKERLIDVAQEFVQTCGYNGFSYRDISERVGIKTSSIHYHFPAKGDLVLALVQRYRRRFSAGLAAILELNESPGCRLDRYLTMVSDSFTTTNLICLCGMLATDSASLPPSVVLEIRGFFADNEAFLTPLLEAGRESGEFHYEGDTAETATSFFAAMQGAMISAYTFGEGKRVVDAAKWLRATLRN